MRSFIIRCLRKVRGEQVEGLIQDSLPHEERFKEDLREHNGNIEAAIDINHFPHIIRKYWHRDRVFSQQFNSNSKVQFKTGTIADGRNLWAHPGVEDLDSDRTQADLTYVAEVLGEINNGDAKREVEEIRDRLFSTEVEEHPAKVENTALKENLSEMSDKLASVEVENADLKKRLKQSEVENAALKDHIADISDKLVSIKAEKTDYEKRLQDTQKRLEDLA